MILEQLLEEAKHIPNIQIFSSADEVIQHEPILKPVKDRLYAGVFSSLDTNSTLR